MSEPYEIDEGHMGNWEFTIAAGFQTAKQFSLFREALDAAILDAETNGMILILKSIAPVGTTETHIDTRLQEN